MSPVVSLIDLAGSIAMLLWGTHMVQTGVQRAFGSKLRSILGAHCVAACALCSPAWASPPCSRGPDDGSLRPQGLVRFAG